MEILTAKSNPSTKLVLLNDVETSKVSRKVGAFQLSLSDYMILLLSWAFLDLSPSAFGPGYLSVLGCQSPQPDKLDAAAKLYLTSQ